jgi:hypothetical protein
MKNLIMIMIGLFASISLSAQATSAEHKNEPQAHIDFTLLTYDFGNITVNSDAVCEFTFTNTGKVPLILSNVRASCGCTVPEWPKDPILPGEKGVIKVKYTTVSRPNIINKSIIVQSNADNKQVVLRIKGEVVAAG